MTDISANRTDLMDTSRQPGELPASTQGQATARDAQAAALPQPGGRGPLTRPTERPSEPVTAGLSLGPGEGPVSGDASGLDRVRAAYRRFPSSSLRRLLEVMERAEAQ